MKKAIFLMMLTVLRGLVTAQVAFAQSSAPPFPLFNRFEKDAAARTGAAFAHGDTSQAVARAAYAKLALSFVPNAGQMDARVRYSAQSGGRSFYFTTREAVFSFAAKSEGLVLRLAFLGANTQTEITGEEQESGRVHYLVGNDPARWHTNLPTYDKVVYRDLWPGIDLLFRGENGQLNYEFLIRPGARVQDIRLAYRGVERLSVDDEGNLIIHTSLGDIADTHPVTFQLVDGQRLPVASHFVLARGGRAKNTYGFAVGDYDKRKALVLDPGLVYSTYLGGIGDDEGNAIAVDSCGQAYVAGDTYSTDFPTTTGAYDRSYNGGEDVFVTKLNSSGSCSTSRQRRSPRRQW